MIKGHVIRFTRSGASLSESIGGLSICVALLICLIPGCVSLKNKTLKHAENYSGDGEILWKSNSIHMNFDEFNVSVPFHSVYLISDLPSAPKGYIVEFVVLDIDLGLEHYLESRNSGIGVSGTLSYTFYKPDGDVLLECDGNPENSELGWGVTVSEDHTYAIGTIDCNAPGETLLSGRPIIKTSDEISNIRVDWVPDKTDIDNSAMIRFVSLGHYK